MGKCQECPEPGLPEWIMSYADMITILMAFFVVMYSMAGNNKDTAKEQAVLKSLRDQFGPNWIKFTGIGPGPYVPHNSALAHLKTRGSGSSKKPMGNGDARISSGDHPRVQTIRPGDQSVIGTSITFPDDQSTLTPEMEDQLKMAAAELGGKPQRVEIRGHTSRRPLPKGSALRDNWDLAYDRCRNTMQYLIKQGIDPRRIRLGVAADNEPKSGGSEGELRQLVSRVDVFLLNELYDRDDATPAPQPKPRKPLNLHDDLNE